MAVDYTCTFTFYNNLFYKREIVRLKGEKVEGRQEEVTGGRKIQKREKLVRVDC